VPKEATARQSSFSIVRPGFPSTSRPDARCYRSKGQAATSVQLGVPFSARSVFWGVHPAAERQPLSLRSVRGGLRFTRLPAQVGKHLINGD
jgi:hypothetical protein